MKDKDNKPRYDSNELTVLFREVFNTEKGKEVLSVLERKFYDQMLVPANCADGVALGMLSYLAIGQRDVVKYIKDTITRELPK